MNRSIPIFLSVLTIFTGIVAAQPLWEVTGGPIGGVVQCFAKNGTSPLYCGTWMGGVYSSTDNGLNWQRCGLLNETIWSLMVTSTGQVFAGTDQSGIYGWSSTTGWVRDTAGLHERTIYAIAVNSNNIVFAQASDVSGSSYYRSTNNGNSWSAINSGVPTTYAYYTPGLGVAPNNYLYTGGFDTIYRSTNNGDSWTAIASLVNNSIDCFTFSSATIYAGGNQVVTSTNNGATWTQVGTITNNYCYGLDIAPNGDLYAATTKGILRKATTSTNWTRVGVTDQEAYAVCTRNAGWMVAGSRVDGVSRSIDGTTWTPTNGIISTLPKTILFRGTTDIFTGTIYGGVFRSINNGTTWTRISPPTLRECPLAINLQGHLLAGLTGFDSAGSYYTGLYRSIDNGSSWTASGLTDTIVTMIVTAPMNNLYAVTGDGDICRSTNGGSSWASIQRTPIHINAIHTYSTAIPESWLVFAATDSGLYRFQENGQNWTRMGMRGIPVYDLMNGMNGIIYTAAENGIYSSNNSGTTWTSTNFTNTAYTLVSGPNNTIFFASVAGTVYRSVNQCSSWTAYSNGLPASIAFELTLNPNDNRIFAGLVGAGIYRTVQPVTGIADAKPPSALPVHATLLPNFPNPFNSTTSISFLLPNAADTKIEIYNSTGQIVQTILSSRMSPGIHRVQWNAGGHPSGIYWCRMTAGSEITSRRLLFIK